ncbi:MAG: hypothetical protein JKY60_14145 [Kordiimonadaceae bacterium]|nr:hypothetical protein [Kordiimonadaceae bacterium]
MEFLNHSFTLYALMMPLLLPIQLLAAAVWWLTTAHKYREGGAWRHVLKVFGVTLLGPFLVIGLLNAFV